MTHVGQRSQTLASSDAAILSRALARSQRAPERSFVNERKMREVSAERARRGSDGRARVARRPRRSATSGSRASGSRASGSKKARPARGRARSTSAPARPRRAADAAPAPGTASSPAPFAALAALFASIPDRLAALSGRGRRLAIAGAVVLVTLLFFYGPASDLYAAARDHAYLARDFEAITQVTSDLQAEVDRLRTEEGVMDEARVRGYAPEGEIPADASELVGEDDEPSIPLLSQPAEPIEVPAYLHVLDVVMGYEPPEA